MSLLFLDEWDFVKVWFQLGMGGETLDGWPFTVWLRCILIISTQTFSANIDTPSKNAAFAIASFLPVAIEIQVALPGTEQRAQHLVPLPNSRHRLGEVVDHSVFKQILDIFVKEKHIGKIHAEKEKIVKYW